MVEIRPARADDRPAIVEILHHGWHDGHAHLVSPEVLPLRTLECIDDIFAASTDSYHVAEEEDRILGFVAVNGDELTKLFIARHARGSGVAEKLLAHGEKLIADSGFAVARLICQTGNLPAERFYARTGWVEAHRGHYPLWMPKGATGNFTAEAMMMQKRVRAGG